VPGASSCRGQAVPADPLSKSTVPFSTARVFSWVLRLMDRSDEVTAQVACGSYWPTQAAGPRRLSVHQPRRSPRRPGVLAALPGTGPGVRGDMGLNFNTESGAVCCLQYLAAATNPSGGGGRLDRSPLEQGHLLWLTAAALLS